MSIFNSNNTGDFTSKNDAAMDEKPKGKRGRPSATIPGTVLTNGMVGTRIDGKIHLFAQYIDNEGNRVVDDIVLKHDKKKDKLTLVTIRAGIPVAELDDYKDSLKAVVEVQGISEKTSDEEVINNELVTA